MMIKAIETSYKGYRFRSRLEARWAVFFDALGIKWEYELEGFDLGDGLWYLPDFFLQDGERGYYLEIKPSSFDLHSEENSNAITKCLTLAETSPCFMLVGTPTVPKISTIKGHSYLAGGYYGLAFCTTIDSTTGKPIGTGNHHSWEDPESHLVFYTGASVLDPRPWCWHERTNDASFVIWPLPANEAVSKNGKITFVDPLIHGIKSVDSPKLIAAYTAARSARFER